MVPPSVDDVRAARRRQNFSKQLVEKGWYHSFELPDGTLIDGVVSLEHLRNRYAEFPFPAALNGKTALDIGTWDGWCAFEMERRGARVVAVDCVELEHFLHLHKLLNSKVQYRILDMYELSAATVGRFDFVLFLGVLYHLKHPLLALEIVCELTREIAVVESFVANDGVATHHHDTDIPWMEFYESDELGEQLDNWIGPSLECLLAMCRAAGFARVELLSANENRASVACYRHWEPPPESPKAGPPELVAAVHNRNYGVNFDSRREEYLTCWFRTSETDLSRQDMRPEVGGYGVQNMYVKKLEEDNAWHVNFRLPPGLTPGWHDVRLRTVNSDFSNALKIAVDIPAQAERLKVNSVCDGITWKPLEVAVTDAGFISFWINGLSTNCDRNNVRVYLGDARLSVEFISEPDVNRFRQINVRVPGSAPKGEQALVVRFGSTESEPVTVTVK